MPRERPAGHDDYGVGLVSGEIAGVITALSPVHVASGQIELTGKAKPPLVKAHFRSGGQPVIPGTSLKGAIRSIVEAISPSCLRVTRARYDQQPMNVRACQKRDDLCVACRMFGALGYQGQVRFSDAVQRENHTEFLFVPSFYAPRSRERLYYEGGQIKGRKFYQHGELARGNVPIEACPEGSRFTFTVYFDNLTPGELGLLLIALGQGMPKLRPKLGGAKPACLGSIDIALERLMVLDMAAAYADYEAAPQPVEPMKYLEAARELVLAGSLKKLADILQYPGGRQCPDRNY
jgi:CRISPR/Cas system CSM-associated protein Csm3 (group 7 of RAMP superfamily)